MIERERRSVAGGERESDPKALARHVRKQDAVIRAVGIVCTSALDERLAVPMTSSGRDVCDSRKRARCGPV